MERMRTNADAEQEMWSGALKALYQFPKETFIVTRHFFPDPIGVSFKRIAEGCPSNLEATVEDVGGDERLLIRRRFIESPIRSHFREFHRQKGEEQ